MLFTERAAFLSERKKHGVFTTTTHLETETYHWHNLRKSYFVTCFSFLRCHHHTHISRFLFWTLYCCQNTTEWICLELFKSLLFTRHYWALLFSFVFDYFICFITIIAFSYHDIIRWWEETSRHAKETLFIESFYELFRFVAVPLPRRISYALWKTICFHFHHSSLPRHTSSLHAMSHRDEWETISFRDITHTSLTIYRRLAIESFLLLPQFSLQLLQLTHTIN